jgi:hypothetical protein
MSFPRITLRTLGWSLVLLAIAAGCRPQDQITRYTVPKPHLVDPTLTQAAQAPAIEQQMLGAIVLVDDAGWFFKLTGDPAAVGPLEDSFETFVKSLKFTGTPPEPKWTLPADWKELPGSGLRFATIQIESATAPLDLSVTTLGKGKDDDAQTYVISNVNRWRGQVGLEAISADELSESTKSLQVDGHAATLVSLIGQGTGGMPGAPFAGPAAPPVVASTGSGSTSPELTFKRPESWTEAPPKTFGLARFIVGEGDKSVEITVSTAGGELLANVNRWREQVGLPPVKEAELATIATKIDTLGVKGDYVALVGPARTILGVVVPVRGSQYFVKLTGTNDLAAREKANFESFVKSLKLK